MVASRSLNLFSIAPAAPFLATLAEAIETGRLLPATTVDPANPLAIADVTVLLPTRRACRALRDLLLERSGGRTTVLPRIRPLGDVDEEALGFDDAAGGGSFDAPDAIPALSRHMLMTRLVLKWREEIGSTLSLPHGGEAMTVPAGVADAVRLASDLADLLDGVETEGGRLETLFDLVPEDHSDYYGLTLAFLQIVTEWWPELLSARSAIDPARRRNILIDAEKTRLATSPDHPPVIAAGSTGSIPSSARLLATIAAHPNGALVLPGLDLMLDEDSFGAILAEDHVSHPQFGMAQLLARMGGTRQDVVELGQVDAVGAGRTALLSEAMRPVSTTNGWAALTDGNFADQVDPAMTGLTLIEAGNEREEALAVALSMREAIREPGRRAALVTPDRELAGRVAAELGRWGLDVDDSAGTPLSRTLPGTLSRLLLDAVSSAMAPIAMLALMKHPLFRMRRPANIARSLARRLELAIYRGPRPAAGPDGLVMAAAKSGDETLTGLADDVAKAVSPLAAVFETGQPIAFGELVRLHWQALASVSADENGNALAASGEAGEMLADHVTALIDCDRDASPEKFRLAPADYPAAFAAFMAGRTLRPRGPSHPRLQILGLLEARLQYFDRLILGGLDEGVWPDLPNTDPWLSRPMRRDMGLAAPERRIGLMGHDLVQAICSAPDVVLSRAIKRDRTPTVPSRWLQRLSAVLEAAERDRDDLGINRSAMQSFARRLDHAPQAPIGRPEPRPPVVYRPRQLSVTQVETFVRDPYAIYARHVLGLRPLDPIDAEPGAADRGTMIHGILAAFLVDPLSGDREDDLARLVALGEAEFRRHADHPSVQAIWWPRFLRVASEFVAIEAGRQAAVVQRLVETSGALAFDAPAGRFRLTAKADRIDILDGNRARIIDYKTGTPPSGRWSGPAFRRNYPSRQQSSLTASSTASRRNAVWSMNSNI